MSGLSILGYSFSNLNEFVTYEMEKNSGKCKEQCLNFDKDLTKTSPVFGLNF